MDFQTRSIGTQEERSFGADEVDLVRAASGVAGPANAAAGNGGGCAALQCQREETEIFHVAALVGLEEVVGGAAKDGFDGAT